MRSLSKEAGSVKEVDRSEVCVSSGGVLACSALSYPLVSSERLRVIKQNTHEKDMSNSHLGVKKDEEFKNSI